MYKIYFFDDNNNRYDFCEFGLLPDEHLLDKLEEVLFIMQELTPCTNRCSWAFPFLRGEKVQFTYHNCEFVKAWIEKENVIYVKNI
jgi:hypothetical protein